MVVTELVRGKVYWKVLKLKGMRPRINKIIVLSEIKPSVITESPMVDIIEFPNRSKHAYNDPRVTTLYLLDYNIPKNLYAYNQNRIFDNQVEAEAYAII